MKHKKIVISIIAVVLLATVAYGSTLAWLTDTDEVQNTITLGEVETEIIEEYIEGNGTFKRSKVKNMSEVSPCLVRARVTISPAEVADDIVLKDTDDTGWSWPQGWSDGEYILYDEILKAGEETDYLFTGIERPTDAVIKAWSDKGITSFDIAVYEESVQAVVWKDGQEISAINEDGTFNPTNANLIWNLYDSNLLQNKKE